MDKGEQSATIPWMSQGKFNIFGFLGFLEHDVFNALPLVDDRVDFAPTQIIYIPTALYSPLFKFFFFFAVDKIIRSTNLPDIFPLETIQVCAYIIYGAVVEN